MGGAQDINGSYEGKTMFGVQGINGCCPRNQRFVPREVSVGV